MCCTIQYPSICRGRTPSAVPQADTDIPVCYLMIKDLLLFKFRLVFDITIVTVDYYFHHHHHHIRGRACATLFRGDRCITPSCLVRKECVNPLLMPGRRSLETSFYSPSELRAGREGPCRWG